jgi:hypothetical protein
VWSGHAVRDPLISAPSLRPRGAESGEPDRDPPTVVEVTAPDWTGPAESHA